MKTKTDSQKLEELQEQVNRDLRYKVESLEDRLNERRFRAIYVLRKKNIIEFLTIPLIISIIYAIIKNA